MPWTRNWSFPSDIGRDLQAYRFDTITYDDIVKVMNSVSEKSLDGELTLFGMPIMIDPAKPGGIDTVKKSIVYASVGQRYGKRLLQDAYAAVLEVTGGDETMGIERNDSGELYVVEEEEDRLLVLQDTSRRLLANNVYDIVFGTDFGSGREIRSLRSEFQKTGSLWLRRLENGVAIETADSTGGVLVPEGLMSAFGTLFENAYDEIAYGDKVELKIQERVDPNSPGRKTASKGTFAWQVEYEGRDYLANRIVIGVFTAAGFRLENGLEVREDEVSNIRDVRNAYNMRVRERRPTLQIIDEASGVDDSTFEALAQPMPPRSRRRNRRRREARVAQITARRKITFGD